MDVRYPVMGKSHRNRDLSCDLSTFWHSIQKTVIRFDSFGTSIWKKNLNRDKSASCLLTRNGIHKSSRTLLLWIRFQYFMPKFTTMDVRYPVMGKSQSQPGFKLRLEHILTFDSKGRYSIWQFWNFDLKKNLNRDKSASCLLTRNGIHKSSRTLLLWLRFQYFMPKLHSTNWMIDTVSTVTTEKSFIWLN